MHRRLLQSSTFDFHILRKPPQSFKLIEDTQVEYISQNYTFGKYTFEKYALRFMFYALRFTLLSVPVEWVGDQLGG